MKTIDVDEAGELTIRCKRNRTFDLNVNIKRSTLGKTYKLQVKNSSGETVLTFEPGNGMTIEATTVKLLKTPAEMAIPTGYYQYDLVEIINDHAENILVGWLIVQPSFTNL